ncbi:MAG: hypothetical protein ACRDUV_23980, partial [Pseudonocardiaceae bacterium]
MRTPDTPTWEPQASTPGRHQHHLAERSLLSSKEPEALLLDADAVREGVHDSLEPKRVSTVPLIASRIDELGFSSHDFHPAEILPEDMH